MQKYKYKGDVLAKTNPKISSQYFAIVFQWSINICDILLDFAILRDILQSLNFCDTLQRIALSKP